MFSSDYSQVKETSSLKALWPGFVKAILFAVGLTLVVFFVGALLLTYTPLSEGAIPFIAIATAVISVIIAGAIMARTVGHRGYLSGALMGGSYMVLLYLVSLLIAGDFHFSSYMLVLLAIGLLGGAFGGILGINLFGNRRR
ncbi:MAG: TIGR04086 family membrane protein [Ruminococcaceae bacterium]|nr:TIGR04086 family membrane protein [Oscillospiraceae bacterium]